VLLQLRAPALETQGSLSGLPQDHPEDRVHALGVGVSGTRADDVVEKLKAIGNGWNGYYRGKWK